MTLIDALKRLAELFPEKWKCYDDGMIHLDSEKFYPRYIEYISTEDCDRILAEHGMVMWTFPKGVTRIQSWEGRYGFLIDKGDHDGITISYCPTKRLATEATFLSALEYIIKTKEGK